MGIRSYNRALAAAHVIILLARQGTCLYALCANLGIELFWPGISCATQVAVGASLSLLALYWFIQARELAKKQCTISQVCLLDVRTGSLYFKHVSTGH